MKLETIITFIRAAALAAILAAVSGPLPIRFGASAAGAQPDASPIDRHALVTRHNIESSALATTFPLGNGEFSFTADATGLQTFAGNTMSHWSWHSFPGKDDQRPLNLGRLRLCHGDGSAVTKKEVTAVKRTLDLWSGTQTAHFEIAGQPVRVETCADPKHDAVAVRIESPLLAQRRAPGDARLPLRVDERGSVARRLVEAGTAHDEDDAARRGTRRRHQWKRATGGCGSRRRL